MVRRKLFAGSSSIWNKSDMTLIYQSATETLVPEVKATSCYWQYERIGSVDSEASISSVLPIGSKKGRKPPTLKLGSGGNSNIGLHRTRVARLNSLAKAPAGFMGKMREHYAAWKGNSHCASLRISDLFAGNQLFLHVHPAPVKSRKKQHELKPSLGFLAGFPESGPGT